MASESNELTFVRCPSCRSLVPASASRCRICNNPLEASGAAGGGEAAKGTSRVRQRTVSATADQILGVAGEAEQDAPKSEAFTAVAAQQPEEGFDPLGAFLEDFDEPAPTQAPPPPVAAKPEDLDPLDLFDDGDLDPMPVAAEPAVQEPTANHDELDPLSALMDEELIPEPAATQAPVALEEKVVEPPAPPPPKREVEAPAPPPPPKREAAPPPPQRQPNPQQQPKAPQGNNQRNAQGNHEARNNRDSKHHEDGRHDRRDGHRHEKRNDEFKRGPQQQHGGKQHERHAHADRTSDRPHAHAQGGPRMGKVRPGRLFGWLVSFESPDGRAIELREGKFFVTGTSIRGTDLVVEDPSISTPHALMSVSGDGGLMIQDLMSDRGVFRRSGERGQYVREDGVFTLEHGDWVRFGDVEFLVTVVPSHK